MMSTSRVEQQVRSRRERRIRKILSTGLTYLALLAFSIFFLMPIVWIVMTSFKRQVDTFSIPPVWIFTPVLDHYEQIFWRNPIWDRLLNSVIASFGAVLISTVVGSVAAYGISRMGKKAYDNVSFWFLSQRMLPLVVIVLPLFMIFRTLRLYDTHLGLILAYTNLSLPFVVWMMITYFDDLPLELEEAAMIDGCNRVQIFFRIALPLVAPGLVATAVFCLALTWSDFLLALILTGPKTKTIPLEILGYFYPSGTEGFNWGPLTAISVIVTLPVFLFILLVQKRLVRGLTLGAVKG
jgi:multiple sugar transport system permease protein